MAGIYEMAKELGGALARTEEYQALRRAADEADQDRELVAVRNRLTDLEGRIEAALRAGREPEDDLKQAYEETASEIQAMPIFQRVVAAQANFEKVMGRINDTMAQGLQEGAKSRIIVSS